MTRFCGNEESRIKCCHYAALTSLCWFKETTSSCKGLATLWWILVIDIVLSEYLLIFVCYYTGLTIDEILPSKPQLASSVPS